MKRRVRFIAYASIGMTCLSASSEMRIHTVQAGDMLSLLAKKYLSGPIYGKLGSLRKLIALNPQISDPNRLYPGYQIAIDEVVEVEVVDPELAQTNEVPAPPTGSREPAQESQGSIRQPVAQASKPQEEFERYSYFTVAPGASYSKIEGVDLGTGASASILSDLNLGSKFGWFQVWSESSRTFVNVDFQRISLLDAETGKTIAGATQTYSGLGLGAETDLNSRLTVGGNVSIQQEVFYRSTGVDSVQIDKVSVPEAELFARYSLIPTSPLGAGAEGKYRLLLPASSSTYDTKSGSAYELGLYLEQSLASLTLTVNTYFSRANYDSSIAEHKRTDLGLGFSIRFEVGK